MTQLRENPEAKTQAPTKTKTGMRTRTKTRTKAKIHTMTEATRGHQTTNPLNE